MSIITNLINVQAPNLPPQNISGVTTLTASSFGKNVVCTGSSAYAVTLPSVTNNATKYIQFTFNTTSFALVTLTPASGTIDGQSTLVYGSNEACTIYTDGTNWITLNKKLIPITFSATTNATQSIANNTATTLTKFGTINFDANSFYTASTGTYLPLYPGKYVMGASVTFASATWTGGGYIQITTGAGVVAQVQHFPLTGGASADTFSVNLVRNFDGSASFFTVQALQTTGGALNVQSSATLCNVYAYRLDNF